MHDDLQAIHDAWDKHVGEGRDESETRTLADAYVAAHPELFAQLRALGDDAAAQAQCVQAIDVLRDQPDNTFGPLLRSTLFGDSEDGGWFLVQVWLWHHFEPQNIGGEAAVTVRMS